MQKRVWLLVLCFLCACLLAASAQTRTVKQGGATYELYDDGTARLVDVHKNTEKLTVPSVIQGCSVTGIVNLPSTSKVTAITLPDTARDIDFSSAFGGAKALTAVTVSKKHPQYMTKNGVVYTKDGASLLYYPMGKTPDRFTIPDTVKRVCAGAISGNSRLKQIVFPKGLLTIEAGAVVGIRSMESISIPASVKSIAQSAFRMNINVRSVSVAKGSKYYQVKNGILYTLDGKTLLYCPEKYAAAKTLSVPKGVTTIGAYAFTGSNSLTSITLPKTVTEIGDYAFIGCDKLTRFTTSCRPKRIGVGLFVHSDQLHITAPRSSLLADYALDNRIYYKSN